MGTNKHAIDEKNDKMLEDLLTGVLNPLLEAVRNDDTLDLELRRNCVNIYYRGGSLFKITSKNKGYTIHFNKAYCLDKSSPLKENPNVKEAVDNIPFYKQTMDWYFRKRRGYEKEFQQLIARENNYTKNISGGTDYYIVDIEYENKVDKAKKLSRFDMVALKWLSDGTNRRYTNRASLALIEVKYGDHALKGDSGVTDHLNDFQNFLSDEVTLKEFCADMSEVFRQKCELGLVEGLNKTQFKVEISCDNPEVIFIFANHDPDSGMLEKILEDVKKQNNCSFPVMVANASSMGYCLYADKMEKIN